MENTNKIDEFRENWVKEIRESQKDQVCNEEDEYVSSVGPSTSTTSAIDIVKRNKVYSGGHYDSINPTNFIGKTATDHANACEGVKVKLYKRLNEEKANTNTEYKSRKARKIDADSQPSSQANNLDEKELPVVLEQRSEQSDDSTFNPFAIIGELCGGTLQQSDCKTVLKPPIIFYPDNINKTKYFEDDHSCQTIQRPSSVTGYTPNCMNSSQAEMYLSNPAISVPFDNKSLAHKNTERILDLFLADLDEITDIPFFDITLPKEVAIKIFHHLDMKDLCRCAQVSRSWRTIAEDELLWCNLCHKLGYNLEYVTVEKCHWKNLLRNHVERKQLLIMNWKNRSGKIEQLQHIKGGILSAVVSCSDHVAAGYTNGDCVLWDIGTGSEHCFQPSNCALVLNENAEGGTLSNYVTKLAVSDNFTAAAFRQGNIDIWNNDKGVETLHTFQCSSSVTQLCLEKSHPLIAFAYGSTVSVHNLGTELQEGGGFNVGKMIADMKLVPSNSTVHQLAIWADNIISVYPATNLTVDMNVIHNMIDSQVISFDVTENCGHMAVGIGNYSEASRILMYDVKSGRLFSTLRSWGIWRLSCMNLKDCPSNCLATGSTDKKIRLFDTRADSNPVSILSGHSHQICTVQMDEWKVAAGVMDGFVCVWDRRMNTKLWELHNRHPVRHCKFNERKLVVGNVPVDLTPNIDEFEATMHRRYRGSIHYYDFEVDQTTQGVPDICSSTFDEPEHYNYNIRLQMPYDKILF